MTDAGLTPIALDVHAHLAPVVEAGLADFAGVEWDREARVLHVDGHAVGMKPLFDAAQLLAWMDRNAVEKAWISAPPPLYRQQLIGVDARAWANAMNDGLAVVAARSEGRLQALFHLPTQDPSVAAGIAAAAITRGHLLFAMPTGTGDDRTLDDPAFEALWATLDKAGAFVFLHPGECADGRLRSFYLSNLLGNPYESTVAIAALVFGGVLQRHPSIRLCFAHGGGLAPMVAGRWQRGHGTARPGIDPAAPAPDALLRRIHVDCICHSEPAAALAETTFGPDKVVFGSDWPFPMGLVEPHEQLGSFEKGRRARFLSDNPRRLLEQIGADADDDGSKGVGASRD